MDLDELERIVRMMTDHDLVEVLIRNPETGTKIRLRKRGAKESPHPVMAPMQAIAAPSWDPTPRAAPAIGAAPAEAAPPVDRGNLVEVPSPMVGTFYRSASPDASPFVEVGARIETETVVCIIEAMKVMNEITAEVSGEVVEILVKNGEAVEYGQPLLLVRVD